MASNKTLKWVFGIGVIFVWLTVFGDKGLISLGKLSHLKNHKEKQITSLIQENKALREKIGTMQYDELEIRREILKTFGMVGEGEILFELKSDSG